MIENKEYPRIATGILVVNSQEKIFLGKSTKFDGLWIVPGGHLEYGETLVECVKREAQEELGVTLSNVQQLQIQESLPGQLEGERYAEEHKIFINFIAEMKNFQDKIKLNDEYSDYVFIEPEKALKQLSLNNATEKFITAFIKQSEDN